MWESQPLLDGMRLSVYLCKYQFNNFILNDMNKKYLTHLIV